MVTSSGVYRTLISHFSRRFLEGDTGNLRTSVLAHAGQAVAAECLDSRGAESGARLGRAAIAAGGARAVRTARLRRLP